MNPHGCRLTAIASVFVGLCLASGARAAAVEANGLTTKVLGYHVSWRGWTDSPTKVPWEHLTHLSYFALAARRDGSLGFNDSCPPHSPTPCWTNATFLSLTTAGHARGVKVGLSLVAANDTSYSTYQDSIHAFLDPAVRPVLIDNILARLNNAGADGVDVDIEWPRAVDATVYASFVGELTRAVHGARPGSYVYVAAPAWDYPGLNNYPTLADSSDGLAIMGYGYHGDFGGSEPGPVAPISNGAKWLHPPYDLIETLDWYDGLGIPESKLLLGFPVYGTEWPTTSATVPGTRAAGAMAFPFVKDDYPYASQPINDCERLLSVDRQWDPVSQTPYRVRLVDGMEGSARSFTPWQYRQLFCEDLASMAIKLQLIKDRGLAGTFFWAENYLPPNYPFWRLVDRKFKQPLPTNQPPVVSIVQNAPVSAGESVTLDGGIPSDADGDGLILQWALQSGPPGPALVYAAANDTTFTTVPQTPGNYTFTLTAMDGIDTTTASTVLVVQAPVSVDKPLPREFTLSPARPSPSAGPVSFEFALPRAADVRLSVMDVQGREVRTLASGRHSAGRHAITWDARSGAGQRAPAGLYFVRLRTPEGSLVRRLVLSR